MLTLNEFVEANRPPEIRLSLEQIQQAVERLPAEEGWQFITDPALVPDMLGPQKGMTFAVVRFEGSEERSRGIFGRKTSSAPKWEGEVYVCDELVIQFMNKVLETAIKYSPYYETFPRSTRGKSPFYRLLDMAGISGLMVETPEPVVTLPVPGWVTAYGEDGYATPYVEGRQVFVSEARGLWDEFLSQRPF